MRKTRTNIENARNGRNSHERYPHDSVTYRFIVLSSQVDDQEDEDEKEYIQWEEVASKVGVHVCVCVHMSVYCVYVWRADTGA